MTATVLSRRFAASARAAGALAGGCFLLVLRQHLADQAASPTVALVAVFLAIGFVGLCWPVGTERPGLMPGTAVLALGLAAFAFGRLIGGGHPPAPFGTRALALNSLAAVADCHSSPPGYFSDGPLGEARSVVMGAYRVGPCAPCGSERLKLKSHARECGLFLLGRSLQASDIRLRPPQTPVTSRGS